MQALVQGTLFWLEDDVFSQEGEGQGMQGGVATLLSMLWFKDTIMCASFPLHVFSLPLIMFSFLLDELLCETVCVGCREVGTIPGSVMTVLQLCLPGNKMS